MVFKNKVLSKSGKILFILDTMIIVIALFSAWLIRAQFEYFLYGMKKFIFLFPWVLFSRLFFHFFFELYSFNPVSLNNRDIMRIFKYNILPSIILLALRFFPGQNELIKMPLSMIAMEYIFSTVGFLVLRLMFHSKNIKKDRPRGYCRRLILWGEVREIEEKLNFDILFEEQNIEIVGILNDNPLYWNTEYKNIRVYGSADEIVVISAADDRVSGVVVLASCELTKKQKKNIKENLERFHMEFGCIENNRFIQKPVDWIFSL